MLYLIHLLIVDFTRYPHKGNFPRECFFELLAHERKDIFNFINSMGLEPANMPCYIEICRSCQGYYEEQHIHPHFYVPLDQSEHFEWCFTCSFSKCPIVSAAPTCAQQHKQLIAV